MSLFPSLEQRKRRLFAQMNALQAKKEGLSAAEIVPPPPNKPSLGKIAFLLGGIGLVVGYVVWGIPSFLTDGEEKGPEEPFFGSKKPEKPKDESKALVDRIRLFHMEEEKRMLSAYEEKKKTEEIQSQDWIYDIK